MLYADAPDLLATELAHYRAVTPASIASAIDTWLAPSRMIDVETVPRA
jgi:hypothetical protein